MRIYAILPANNIIAVEKKTGREKDKGVDLK